MITIVSGLPRCGTSLMMRMLDMGGLPALSDNVRTADEDNPKGYYEFERVKETKADASWLAEADGKAVKMVSQLLYDLPEDRSYQVIFMDRHLDEMMASQNKMLERLGKPLAGDDDQMRVYLQKHLDQIKAWWAAAQHLSVLEVSYNALMAEPEPIVTQVAQFVGAGLDEGRMLAAIDKDLYRQRKAIA